MKVAISGSHGFIGSAFVKRLKELGHTVVPISREQLYEVDLLQMFFMSEEPDWIIHCASYGNMRSAGQTQPDLIIAANIGCTYNMLEASLSIPYKAFINIGSSSEYGEKTEPMSETDLPETETFYGATKVGAGYIARAFVKQYVKPIVNIRPFSVYGEHEADFRFIPTVIRNILQGTRFSLQDEATHDWVYVKDFVNATLLVAKNAKELQGGWVNIGTGKSYTNKLIVEMIETFLDKKARFKSVKSVRNGDSPLWEADINKLSNLGFKHAYDISEGLAETIKWYKNKYEE